MKHVNGYWVDSNNNRWDSNYYSKTKAEKHSESLINCRNCLSCQNCQNCWDCQNCQNCWDCWDCQNCQNCWDCRNCQNCQNCWGCRNCQNCLSCRNCRNCQNCLSCQDCRDCLSFKSNPARVIFPPIGSRNSQTTVYWSCTGQTQILCGCFSGTIQQFEKVVSLVHGNNEHGQRYISLINQVYAMMEV